MINELIFRGAKVINRVLFSSLVLMIGFCLIGNIVSAEMPEMPLYDKYLGCGKDNLIKSISTYDEDNSSKVPGTLEVTSGKKKIILPYDEMVAEGPGASWMRDYYFKNGKVIAITYEGRSILGAKKDSDNFFTYLLKKHRDNGYKVLRKSGNTSAEMEKGKVHFNLIISDKYGTNSEMWKVEYGYEYFLTP